MRESETKEKMRLENLFVAPTFWITFEKAKLSDVLTFVTHLYDGNYAFE